MTPNTCAQDFVELVARLVPAREGSELSGRTPGQPSSELMEGGSASVSMVSMISALLLPG